MNRRQLFVSSGSDQVIDGRPGGRKQAAGRVEAGAIIRFIQPEKELRHESDK